MISVIVPAYNIEKEIKRALDSILAQTVSHLEIIVVDDGSTDGTSEVIDQYATSHPGRIVALHIPNSGVTNARLTGVAHASGEWIGFVDADDEIEPDMYERLLQNAIRYHADISHCGYQMLFPDGRVSYFHNTKKIEEQKRDQALRELLSGKKTEPGLWNKMFRKTLFGGWEIDRRIKINEDLLMNFYLFSRASKIVYEDWCPYHYIVRNSSVSRGRLNQHKIYDPIQVKDIIRQSITVELTQEAQCAYLNTCIAVYHSLITAGKDYRSDANIVRERLLKEKDKLFLLGKKRRFLVSLIIYIPTVYKFVYYLYYRFLQKNPYI